MSASQSCAACGGAIEPGKGLLIDDRAWVHDERCLERWMLEGGGLPTPGTVLMYPEGMTGPLTPPEGA